MQLLETTLYENGELFLLDRHLERMKQSAAHFSFPWPGDQFIVDSLLKSLQGCDRARVRWTLSEQGEVEVTTANAPTASSQPSYILILDSQPSPCKNNKYCSNKTTQRDIYTRACERQNIKYADAQDVLLFNEDGFATEGSIFNVAFYRNGRWLTPSSDQGLLEGTMRASLLQQNRVEEDKTHELHNSKLMNGEPVLLFNSFRKVCNGFLRINS
ncbi:4-amino-4-deoxychorismate lyase [Schizosaccharomyces japonicus yFS275]|uniref:4-amino-4-deoxychorismate lyase n=1 Tax=Schizosaccharomyces japonicus (strain yFS275 / FY16936) TaxID=402676 RepID=B6K1W2_SCHJY|nr:4-amino-4-deoxychorismate lyase [Schizosaccharomyces japonicus yFS275]EEB07143.1 4-amino-4-deoxychorismate lyase [Schizosaccharomyces japonicus yFS275]